MSNNLSYEGSSLINRNVTVGGKRTSIKLQELEWKTLEAICAQEGLSISDFCTLADSSPERAESCRTSRVRMAVLDYLLKQTKALRLPGTPPRDYSYG